MINYSCFSRKNPNIILNKDGILIMENNKQININFEIDYDSYNQIQLGSIIKNNINEFEEKTICITYINNSKENKINLPINDNNNLEYLKIKTENSSMNFSMIKYKLEILKNNQVIDILENQHKKSQSISLSDGEFLFKFYVYNNDDELISENQLILRLITSYEEIFKPSSLISDINFSEEEGDFKIILSSSGSKLYSFRIYDIVKNNDNIVDFTYFNSDNDTVSGTSKIGSEFVLFSDKRIEEIETHPELDFLAKSKFIFDIKEFMSSKRTKNDIGVLNIPSIKSKIKDNLRKYYDLKCDVNQNYVVTIDKTNDFLISDKFLKEPLFYKTIITDKFKDMKLIDDKNNNIEFLLEDITDDIKILYFNPLRNHKYYLNIDGIIKNVYYKKSHESFIIDYSSSFKSDAPIYFGDLMLNGSGDCEVTIILDNYDKKHFKIKATNKEYKFLEDERVTINNKILSIEVKGNYTKIINMICNLKNNKYDYSYFKKNNKNFTYIAKEVPCFDLNKINDSELNKLNINDNFIIINNVIENISNGPLTLEPIKHTEVIFTDINTFDKENTITEKLRLHHNYPIDEFMNNNILDTNLSVGDD